MHKDHGKHKSDILVMVYLVFFLTESSLFVFFFFFKEKNNLFVDHTILRKSHIRSGQIETKISLSTKKKKQETKISLVKMIKNREYNAAHVLSLILSMHSIYNFTSFICTEMN